MFVNDSAVDGRIVYFHDSGPWAFDDPRPIFGGYNLGIVGHERGSRRGRLDLQVHLGADFAGQYCWLSVFIGDFCRSAVGLHASNCWPSEVRIEYR